jgi:spore germination cell wall hydrolase CwlJ-like protein
MTPDPHKALADQSERALFRMCLWAEARGEDGQGGRIESLAMLGVGCVILNRAAARKQSIARVILAPFQFSWTREVDPNYKAALKAHLIDPISWERADTVADLIELNVCKDPTHGATHYYADYLKPDPAWGRGHPQWRETTTIGHHIFGITT